MAFATIHGNLPVIEIIYMHMLKLDHIGNGIQCGRGTF